MYKTTVPSMRAHVASGVYRGAHLAITPGAWVRRSGCAWSARPARTKPRAIRLMNRLYAQRRVWTERRGYRKIVRAAGVSKLTLFETLWRPENGLTGGLGWHRINAVFLCHRSHDDQRQRLLIAVGVGWVLFTNPETVPGNLPAQNAGRW